MGKVRAGARVGGTTVCAYECVHTCARSRASLSPFQPPRYSLVAFSNRQFAVLQYIYHLQHGVFRANVSSRAPKYPRATQHSPTAIDYAPNL